MEAIRVHIEVGMTDRMAAFAERLIGAIEGLAVRSIAETTTAIAAQATQNTEPTAVAATIAPPSDLPFDESTGSSTAQAVAAAKADGPDAPEVRRIIEMTYRRLLGDDWETRQGEVEMKQKLALVRGEMKRIASVLGHCKPTELPTAALRERFLEGCNELAFCMNGTALELSTIVPY